MTNSNKNSNSSTQTNTQAQGAKMQNLPSTLILSAATYSQAQMHFFGTPEEWNAEWSELTHELTQFEHYAQTQKAQRGFRAWLAEAEANEALEDAKIAAQIAELKAQQKALRAQKKAAKKEALTNSNTQAQGAKMTNPIEITTNLLNTIKAITFIENGPGMVLLDNSFTISDFSVEFLWGHCDGDSGEVIFAGGFSDGTYLLHGTCTHEGEAEEGTTTRINVGLDGGIYNTIGWSVQLEFHNEEAPKQCFATSPITNGIWRL